MATVSFDRVTKRFGGIVAVHDLSVQIPEGECLAFIGPSGSGKSTVLRMLAGLEESTSGEIHIGDRLMRGVAPKERDVAMVFQNYALYPQLSAHDNISFGLRLAGLPEDEIDRRVEDVAALLEIAPLLRRLPRELSGGERQRVALARALAREPGVLLLDDPLSTLDSNLRDRLIKRLRDRHQRSPRTTILVSHEQAAIATLADRVITIVSGALES